MSHRVRIRFAKQDDLRLISHRDLAMTIERLFRRAGVDVAHSEGFHPRPKISYPTALALGIEALNEVLDVELPEPPETDALLAKLRAAAPPGLTLLSAEILDRADGKTRAETAVYRLPLPEERRAAAAEQCQRLLAATEWPIQREGRKEPIDLRGTLVDCRVDDDALVFVQRMANEAAARPGDVVAAVGVADVMEEGEFLTRTEVVIG